MKRKLFKSFLTLCALLIVLLLVAPASGALSLTPRVHAADSNRDVGPEVHSTPLNDQHPRTGESSPPRRPLSFSQSSSLTLNTGEDSLTSAVIDTTNGFAYFVTGTSPGIVVKVDVNPSHSFARVAALTLNTGENSLTSAVIDTTNGFAYFGTDTSPGIVVKVRLSNFTRDSALTLNTGENSLTSAVIDTPNGFAYFGTGTSPGIVVKVDVNPSHSFARVGAVALNSGEDYSRSAVIDTPNGFAYFGTDTPGSPGSVVKVDVNPSHSFTRVAALTLNAGEYFLSSAVIDTTNGFAYFGVGFDFGFVVKVDVNPSHSFTRVGALTLDRWTGEKALKSAVIDTTNGFAYFGGGDGAYATPVVKVRLSDFTHVVALPLNTWGLNSAVIDTPNGFAYFGTGNFPGIVVKVNLGKETTTTITSHTPNPSIVGQGVVVTYTVTSTGGTPTGNVTVSDGVVNCTGTVAAGTCTLTPTSAGAKTLTATYAGDANFNGSAGTASHTVNNNPVPAITLLGPTSAAQGGPDFTLTIAGTNFVDTSIVRWNGATRARTFVSSTELTATITAADIANAGVAYITVFNPGPGGGTSNSQAFFINTTGAPITSSNTVSGTNPSATTGGSTGVTANATGNGTVTVGIYNSNPGGTPSFSSSGAYMDVHVAPGNTFTSLTIVNCNLNGGTQVLWWNGTTWALASNQSYNSSTYCVTIIVDNSTSPSLSQLTGTPFGASVGFKLFLPLILR